MRRILATLALLVLLALGAHGLRTAAGQGGAAAELVLETPSAVADATVRLVRDGRALSERPLPLQAGENRVPLRALCGGGCAPGDYRLELRRGGEPWIFTNPAGIE